MTIAIIQSDAGFECYGAARDFWRYKGQEVVLAGPYETGKTMATVYKLHLLLSKYPGSRGLMVRQTYKSLISSVVVTYENKVLPASPGHPDCPVQRYGGEKPEWYDYPNGSRLTLGGMDHPDKFLSSEFDFIYINQLEEISLDAYEKLVGRATGRAGNAPYSQVLADCNPGAPTHWILARESLKMFKSKHEDNPTLYDPHTGEITEQGERSIAALESLTGVRYKRGRLGLWAGAEGQVYELWDDDIHLIDRFEIPETWERFRSIDFGYVNPFVCQWWALDEDKRLYLYREIYMSRRTVAAHADEIKRIEAGVSRGDWDEMDNAQKNQAWLRPATEGDAGSEARLIRYTVADHDAEDRATLHEARIQTTAAKKDIELGIQRVQERLKIQEDGRPRLFVMRDVLVETDPVMLEKFKPICTRDEVLNYVRPPAKEGKKEDEKPIDLDNHGMDAARYAVMSVDSSGNTMRTVKNTMVRRRP